MSDRSNRLKKVAADREKGLRKLREAAEATQSELVELGDLVIDEGVITRDEDGRPESITLGIPTWAAESLDGTFSKLKSERKLSDDGIIRCSKCGGKLPESGWFNTNDGSGPFCEDCSAGLGNCHRVWWVE